MSELLSDVYEIVTDHNLTAPVTNYVAARHNTRKIQEAIDTGKHVLFPAAEYVFADTIEFDNESQRATFLAGAILVPWDSDSYVRITGRYQTISGLRIEAGKGLAAHSPLLDIDGTLAAGLQLDDIRIVIAELSTTPDDPGAAVRVRNLTKCQFFGGSISGPAVARTVGLLLANDNESDPSGARAGAYETGATGLQVEGFGWAVVVACTCDNPTFIDCGFTDNVDGALRLQPAPQATEETSAYALVLVGCRASGSARQFVQVDAGVNWKAGGLYSCTFDAAAAAAGVPEAKVRGAFAPTCVVRAAGTLTGVTVTGCQLTGAREAIWYITGSPTKTCDMFNAWGETPVAAGPIGDQLFQLSGNASGGLVLTAREVSMSSDRLGFFDKEPGAQGARFTVPAGAPSSSRTLSVKEGVFQLLRDLAALGLVKV